MTASQKGSQGRIRIAVAGATGTVGRGLVAAIERSEGFELGAIVSRDPGSDRCRSLLGRLAQPVHVSPEVDAAVAELADILIDYTHPRQAPINILAAIGAGMAVVIGTSGLSRQDLERIEAAAISRGVGVVAAGNLSITAILMKRFAIEAARYLGAVEVIDYASPDKADAPSGTAIGLAHALSNAKAVAASPAPPDVLGDARSRGAVFGKVPVHALRLNSYYNSIEVIFGERAERLTIRHDVIDGSEPFVRGSLVAARAALGFTGLKREFADAIPLQDLI